MAAILQYLRGRDTTAITITAQDVSATGVLSNTTSATGELIGGRCDGISIQVKQNSESIMAINDIIENNVPISIGYTISLTEILVNRSGTGGIASSAINYEPILPYLFNHAASGTSTYQYFKITIDKGGKEYIVYGLKQSLDDGVRSQGKQTCSMTLVPVNVNFDASGMASIEYKDAA